jgi:hypothetical protein
MNGPPIEPVEFGLGLGAVSGLFLGAGASLLLVIALVFRDAVIERRNAPADSSFDSRDLASRP